MNSLRITLPTVQAAIHRSGRARHFLRVLRDSGRLAEVTTAPGKVLDGKRLPPPGAAGGGRAAARLLTASGAQMAEARQQAGAALRNRTFLVPIDSAFGQCGTGDAAPGSGVTAGAAKDAGTGSSDPGPDGRYHIHALHFLSVAQHACASGLLSH